MSLLLNRVSLAPGEGLSFSREPPRVSQRKRCRDHGQFRQRSPRWTDDQAHRCGRVVEHPRLHPILVDVLDPEPCDGGSEYLYPTPVPEFVLRRWELDVNREVALGGDGPAVVLCTSGRVKIRAGDHQMEISGSEAVWLRAGDSVTMTAADGEPAQVFAGSTPS